MVFRQDLFPESYKSGRVTPVYKKDDPQIPCNYHPVSILSGFSKLDKKCLYSHVFTLIFVFIASGTFGRRDIKIVMVLCNSKRCRKSYAFYVITLGKRTPNLTNIRLITLFGQTWSKNSKLFV